MGVQRQELDWLVEQRGQYGAEAVLSDMVSSGELDKPRIDKLLEKYPADKVFQAILSQLERRAASEQAIRQEAEQEPVEPKLSVAERLLEAMPALGRPRGVGEDPFLKMTRAVLEPVGRKVTRPLVGELQRKIRGAETTEEIRSMIDEPTPDSINRLRLLAFERLMPDIADLGEEYRAKILTMYPRMVQEMYPNLMKVKSREALRRDAIDFAEDLLAPEASEVRTGKRIGLTPKAWLAGAHPDLAFVPTITEKALDRFFIEPYFLRPEQGPTELVIDIGGGLFLRGAAKGVKNLAKKLAKVLKRKRITGWMFKDITAPLRKYLKREAVTLSRATWDDFLNQSVELRELPEQAGRALAGLTDDQIAEIGRQLEKFKAADQVTVGMPRKILRTKGQPKTFGGWSLPEDLPVMDVTPLYEGPLEEIVAGQADRVIPIGKTAGMSLVDEVPEQIFRELTSLDRMRLKIDDVVQAGDHTGRIVDVSDPALVTVELPSGHTVKVGRKGISGLLDREPVQLTLGLEPEVPMPTASAQAATHKTLKDVAGEAAEAAKEVAARRLGQMPQAFQDFAGYSAVAKEAFAKLRTPHRDVITDVFGAVEKWRAELNKAALYTDWARDSLLKMKLKPDQMAVVTRWLDEPAHYKKAFEALPSEYHVLGKILRMDYTDMHTLAKENGILRAWIENYSPHMYTDRQSRILRNLYPSGGRLGKKFKFAMMRKYKTFRKAEAAGLTPMLDPILLNATYKYQLHRTMANKHLVDTIQMLKREDGLPLIMGRPRRPDKFKVWDEEYEFVNVHGFKKYMYVGQVDDLGMLVKLEAKADPDVAKLLNDIYGPWTPRQAAERALRLVQGKIRRIIMFNPSIHGANILSDVMDEVSFIPIPGYSEAKAIKTMRRGSKLYKAKDELVEYAVDTGLQLPGASKIGQELRRELTDIGNISRIWQPVGKAEQWVDDALWTGIVRNSQLGLFEHLTWRVAKRHPEWTKQMVGRTSSSYINTLLGTLPHTWMPRWARQWGSLFLFARNWCVDAETRCMTKEGWKAYNEVELGDEILAFEPETHELKWTPLHDKFINEEYAGKMVRVKNYNKLIMMTPDHKCFVFNSTKGIYEVVLASDLQTNHLIPRIGQFELPSHPVFSDWFVKLVGWMVTDGHIKHDKYKTKSGDRQCVYGTITQSKPSGIEDLKTLGLKMWQQKPRTHKPINGREVIERHRVYSVYVPTDVTRELLLHKLDEGLNWPFLSKLTRSQLELLYKTMMLGDGTGQNRFCGKEREVFFMSMVQIMLGKPTTFYQQEENCWRTRVIDANKISCWGHSNNTDTVDYNGTIWCPSVDTGFWLAERKGIVFVTGNTFSNIDMVVKVMTRGKKGLGMKALSRVEQREIANMFSLHLAKGLAGLTIYANTVQVGGLLVSNAMKEAGILDGPQLPVHSTFTNEKGHWFDADVGLRNKKGQAQYLVVPQFRYVRDYIGWGAVPIPGESNPARTLYNKMEPALKSMGESMANYSIWRQQKIVERGAPTYKHLVDRAKYFAMTVTPVGRFMARPGQKMTLQEYIAPFAGIWFRRGAPGGKYTGEIFDFLAKEGYKKSELQNEIERLWQEDKVDESMLKMLEKADTPRAMVPMFQNTAGRYAWPLNHYYEKMTDPQRLRFRERLRKRGLLSGLDEALAREAQAVWERED